MEKTCSIDVKREYVSKMEALLDAVDSLTQGRRLIFWGGGNTAKIYWDDMKKTGLTPCYWIDNGAKNNGEEVNGFPLFSSSRLLEEEDKNYVIVIFSMNPSTYQAIKREAEGFTEAICSADALYYRYHRKEIIDFLLCLNDEKSVKTMGEALICRIQGQWNPPEIIEEEQYFPFHNFVQYSPQEVYVDLGAFKGDTIEKYMFKKYGVFNKYYAFEPLKTNFEAMKYRVERLRREWGLADNQIVCENVGCGREKGEFIIRYSSEVAATALPFNAEDEVRVPVVSLDEYFDDKKVSVIKMDIEGMEYAVLEGGKNVIARDRPLLAVCIYHKLSDIVDIPRLINSMGLQYKLDVRCHSENFAETVLYAW